MATNKEMDFWQKTNLYNLLKLKKGNVNLVIIGLDEMIKQAKVGMAAEDVAYVEKLINEEE